LAPETPPETTSAAKLEIVQAGEPVLRQVARPLAADEIRSAEIQQTIAAMLATLRLARISHESSWLCVVCNGERPLFLA
jgi:peptide deformylase